MTVVRGSGASTADRVERFVRREGSVADDDPDFTRQVDLFRAGYLDSLGIVHLIAYLEREFGVRLGDDDLADPGFATIDGITALLDRAARAHSTG
ncbi:acyl carrier protein [Streptomyces olivaceus]|uniref:Acyl carrier protein n=1 Tax=Streptomyces olivaceus TaxID=47716 RepID=A0ABS7WEE6_STROV|nr:acyl carrier protein [Streptomyces olivaceus]MBZ6093504.1 acyl carrier protein [Streptomyces olivaceus]MBZ6100437.1 acyl carrier protein [Streptomyces olivaceus]MBZ6121601.1 acyl carrier protein [Streptomyces olivaceus]MBZ6156337.1 acyl carrier protein [Streptomyces olivaceus]MBZ6302863.1 acyl carrier protein [Streptomyces olivaceus]